MPDAPRVVVLTAGSRGDTEPFVALARGLQRAGCAVTLAAPTHAAALAARDGVPFAPIRADYQNLLASDEGRAMLANPLRAARAWREVVVPLVRATLDDAWAAALGADGRGADALVYHPKVLGAAEMAERLGARAFVAAPAPLLTPTRAFPAPGVTTRDLGGWLNWWTYAVIRGAARPFAGLLRRWREETLGPSAGRAVHGAAHGTPVPVLYAFSAHVVPPPADWPPWAHVTGYWFVDDMDDPGDGDPRAAAPAAPSPWRPSDELLAFLAAGPPPVYVGFGSMAGRDPRATTRTVLAAVQRAGTRAILASGWGGVVGPSRRPFAADLPDGLAPDRVFVLDEAPHAWLFPRVAAVVHHGGAGTTAAGLRAGRPTVVCPFFGDQPFWGARVAALGVGPPPIPQSRLDPRGLAAAIETAATDPAMRERAATLATQLRGEHGVARAATLVRDAIATGFSRRPPMGAD